MIVLSLRYEELWTFCSLVKWQLVYPDCVWRPFLNWTILGITRGHSIVETGSTSEMRQHFFSNRVVTAWNRLDDCIVTAPSLKTFKAGLSKLKKKGMGLFRDYDVRWAPEVDTGWRHGLNHVAVTGWYLNQVSYLVSITLVEWKYC